MHAVMPPERALPTLSILSNLYEGRIWKRVEGQWEDTQGTAALMRLWMGGLIAMLTQLEAKHFSRSCDDLGVSARDIDDDMVGENATTRQKLA